MTFYPQLFNQHTPKRCTQKKGSYTQILRIWYAYLLLLLLNHGHIPQHSFLSHGGSLIHNITWSITHFALSHWLIGENLLIWPKIGLTFWQKTIIWTSMPSPPHRRKKVSHCQKESKKMLRYFLLTGSTWMLTQKDKLCKCIQTWIYNTYERPSFMSCLALCCFTFMTEKSIH